jgi:TPR repeat protein/tetratricopeptide (TPR) repeat protein
MRTLSKASVTIVLGIAILSGNSTPLWAENCLPLPTRPLDSVRLLPNPVGMRSMRAGLSACRANDDPWSRFAEATILVNLGDLDGAVSKVVPLAKVPLDRAAILLADIITEQLRPDDGKMERAVDLYRPFVENGQSDAEEGLGIALLKGSRDHDVRQQAVYHLKNAATHGSTSALGRMGAMLVYTAVDTSEKELGLASLEEGASEGNQAAAIELAKIFAFGWGVEINGERAVTLLNAPALANAREAQYLLATLWKRGWGIPLSRSWPLQQELSRITQQSIESKVEEHRDQLQKRIDEINSQLEVHSDGERAISLLRASAQQEYLPAMVSLGNALAFGRYGQYSPGEGISWLKQALDRGDASAAEHLGILHEMKVAGLNDDEAGDYYKFAADRGLLRATIAMDRLGKTSELGSLPNPASIWRREKQRLDQLATGLGLSGINRENPSRRKFARHLPVDSPYFEASRYVRLSVLDRSGVQLFGGVLSAGDRVSIARNAGEVLRALGLGSPGGETKLGVIYDHGSPVAEIKLGEDKFAEVYGAIPEAGNNGDTRPPIASETGIIFRAWEGPGNAISVHDPEFEHELRTTGYKWEAPYLDSTSVLESATDVGIPALPRIAATIRGGTLFEVFVDGSSVLKDRVPEGANLYLDFSPTDLRNPLQADLRNPLQVTWPSRPMAQPSEVTRDWMQRPSPSVTSNGRPIGWIYSHYDSAADGLYASPLEMNASILAFGAELKGDYQKSLRLRCAEFELSLIRAGGAAIETVRARANIALSLEMLGRMDEAMAVRESAVRYLQSLDAVPNADVVYQLLALANLYSSQGDLTRAIASGREALAMATLLPMGANGFSSTPSDPRFLSSASPKLSAAQAVALLLMKDLPHDTVRQATALLAVLYNVAEDFGRSYVYFQRLAAFDLLDDPDEETNGNMDAYVAIADLAHRAGKHHIGLAAGTYVLSKAKADAGQRYKPDPIPTPITMPQGIEGVFGPIKQIANRGPRTNAPWRLILGGAKTVELL